VDVHDVDVQTDEPGAYRIEQVLRDEVVQPVRPSSSAGERSHFGKLVVSGVCVEVMGPLQKRLPDGSWEPPVDVSPHCVWVVSGDLCVPVLSLRYEADA
jgi:hypothetical protein